MKKVNNTSTCTHYKEVYQDWGEQVAKLYPDYEIIVNGGSFRGYDMKYELDTEKKTMKLDFYLPLYVDWRACKKWLVNELQEKYGVRKSIIKAE